MSRRNIPSYHRIYSTNLYNMTFESLRAMIELKNILHQTSYLFTYLFAPGYGREKNISRHPSPMFLNKIVSIFLLLFSFLFPDAFSCFSRTINSAVVKLILRFFRWIKLQLPTRSRRISRSIKIYQSRNLPSSFHLEYLAKNKKTATANETRNFHHAENRCWYSNIIDIHLRATPMSFCKK